MKKIVKNNFMKQNWKLIFAGIVTGIISGFFGSGGGMLLVPFFTHILKLDEVKARGTTIFCIAFIVISSSIFYINKNFIDFSLSFKCAIGGIIGAIIGSKLLMNLDKKNLKIIFLILLIYSGIKMIV